MVRSASRALCIGSLLGMLSLGACAEEQTAPATVAVAQAFPGDGLGKTDVFGRALAGVAAEYEADLSLSAQEQRLKTDMGFRRQVAWEIVARVIDPAIAARMIAIPPTSPTRVARSTQCLLKTVRRARGSRP